MSVLEGVNARSIANSGCESVQGSTVLDSWMGTDHGICPWDNSLVMRKFDGVVVLGRLWMVFSWGGGTGKEEPSGQVLLSRFWRRHSVPNITIFYVIHYTLSSPPRTETRWGMLHLVPPRTPRSSWYGVLCTCVYVICYMFRV